jgi:hypothetical protein
MPAQKETVIPRASCFAWGSVFLRFIMQPKKQQIPRSAVGFSYGARHRGGARDDSNLIVDSIQLTICSWGGRFLAEGPPEMCQSRWVCLGFSAMSSLRSQETAGKSEAFSGGPFGKLRAKGGPQNDSSF